MKSSIRFLAACFLILIGLMIAASFAGCVHVKYGEASYTRWGDQSLEALEVETADGVKVKLGKQNAEATALEKLIEFVDKRVPAN